MVILAERHTIVLSMAEICVTVIHDGKHPMEVDMGLFLRTASLLSIPS